MSDEVRTLKELQEWLRDHADALGKEANAQQIDSDFDALRVRCIYAESLAKITAQALNHTLTLLQRPTP
jgi:hypothetical protein